MHRTSPVTDLALSGDGKRIALLGERNTLSLWDVESGKWLRDVNRFADSQQVKTLALSKDGSLVAVTLVQDRKFWCYVFETKKGGGNKREVIMLGHQIFFTPDSRSVVGILTHQVPIWDWKESDEIRGGETNPKWKDPRKDAPPRGPRINEGPFSQFSADGEWLYALDKDGRLLKWDLSRRRAPKKE